MVVVLVLVVVVLAVVVLVVGEVVGVGWVVEGGGAAVVLVVGGGAVVGGAGGVGVPGYTASGVEEPGPGFQPGGGLPCEGTGPGTVTTTGVAGSARLGGWCAGTGVPAAWTRPKPARSDHQIELTWTTVPVCGALIISPAPM